jgi:hypothetical protein
MAAHGHRRLHDLRHADTRSLRRTARSLGCAARGRAAFSRTRRNKGLRKAREDKGKKDQVRDARRGGALAIAVLALALAYLLGDRFWLSRNATNSQSKAATGEKTVSATHLARPAISEQSVAVLAFVDVSDRQSH